MLSRPLRSELSQALALSVGVGLFELARSSLFIYSFRFERSHLAELLCYPLLLGGGPALLSRALGRPLSVSCAATWLLTALCALIPFLYERLLFAPQLTRLGLSLGGAAALCSGLAWLWRRGRLSDTRLTLSCALLYCVAIDSGLELSKATLRVLSGQGLPLKVALGWLTFYLGLTLWLSLCQRFSERPRALLSLYALAALGHASLYSDLSGLSSPAPLSRQPPSALKRIEPLERGDIYLLIFDAMRGDAREWLRAQLGESARLEALESLAARAVDFSEAHSGSLATYESIPRLLELKGYQTFVRAWPLKNKRRWPESLPGQLEQMGYETQLLTDYPNAVLKGFDAEDWGGVSSLRGRHLRLLKLPGDLIAVMRGSRALLKARRGATMASVTERPLVDQLAELLRRPRRAPRFVVAHFGAPHQPYAYPPYQPPALPEGFDPEEANESFLGAFSDATSQDIKRFSEHYALALQGADHTLARVMSLLKSHGAGERDLIIVTSDHGELFGDHEVSRLAHGGHLYQASHHVPLLISGWGLPAQRVTEPVSQTRLAETLYALLGQPDPGAESLLVRRSREEAGFELRYAQRGGVAQRGPWRLIWSAHPRWLSRPDWAHREPLELYHVERDPGERHNLAQQRPEVVRRLAAHFKLPLPELERDLQR